jgi:uncharacterized damage-inducible protein DinB
MNLSQKAIGDLTTARERFLRSSNCLSESISGFVPAEGMMSVAQQVAHAARVIDWFMEGAFRPEGFAMDFEEQIKTVMSVESLTVARRWFEKSFDNAISILSVQSDVELMTPLPPGPVLGGLPRLGIIQEMVEHTAHHRGALTIYARLKNIVPPDPYGM